MGFVGVIFSLTIVTLSSLITSIDIVSELGIFLSSIYSLIAVFFILLFMVLSVIFGIGALSVKGWWFLLADADKFHNYYTKKLRSMDEIHEQIYNNCLTGIKNNSDLNDKIAFYLKISYLLFIFSIISIAFSFIYILYYFY